MLLSLGGRFCSIFIPGHFFVCLRYLSTTIPTVKRVSVVCCQAKNSLFFLSWVVCCQVKNSLCFFVFSCFVPYGYLSFNRTQEFQYGFYLLSLIGSLICPNSTAQNACGAKTIAFQKAVVCQNSGHFRSQGCSVNSEQQLQNSKGELRTVNVGSARFKYRTLIQTT